MIEPSESNESKADGIIFLILLILIIVIPIILIVWSIFTGGFKNNSANTEESHQPHCQYYGDDYECTE